MWSSGQKCWTQDQKVWVSIATAGHVQKCIANSSTGQPKKIVCNNKLEAFNRISESEVSELILKGNSKSCCLDPIPTKIIKQILPALLPSITSIINKSLSMSHMPDSLKKAAVTPLFKKTHLKQRRPQKLSACL